MQAQSLQPNEIRREIKSQCASVAKVIPRFSFDAEHFIEKHSALPPEVLLKTLQEIAADGPAMEDVEGFAERTLEQLSAFTVKPPEKVLPVESLPEGKVKPPAREGLEEPPKQPDEPHSGKDAIPSPPGAKVPPPQGTVVPQPQPPAPPEEEIPAKEPDVSGIGDQREASPPADGKAVTSRPTASGEPRVTPAGETDGADYIGWVKVHRKLLRNPIFRNSNLAHFWFYCLLKAVHKPTTAIIGFQAVPLQPGQFIFGRTAASRATGLSETTIRTTIKYLIKTEKIAINPTNKFSVITIVNWQTYQSRENENDQQLDQQATNNQPRIKKNKNIKEKETPKNPSEISDEISVLVSKLFPSLEEKKLFDRIREAISSTRKGGKVAPSLVLAQLKTWEQYPASQVHAAIRIYLEKEYHRDGKNERYLLGIIRNHRPGEAAPRQERTKPSGSGSALLDRANELYRAGKIKTTPAMTGVSQGGAN